MAAWRLPWCAVYGVAVGAVWFGVIVLWRAAATTVEAFRLYGTQKAADPQEAEYFETDAYAAAIAAVSVDKRNIARDGGSNDDSLGRAATDVALWPRAPAAAKCWPSTQLWHVLEASCGPQQCLDKVRLTHDT